MSELLPGKVNGPQPADAMVPPGDLAELSEWLDGLIQAFANHPDPDVRQGVSALLDGIDALHRAALERMVTYLQGPGAESVWARTGDDRVVRTVLRLYDLLPQAEPARPTRPVIPLRLVAPAQPPRTRAWFDVAALDEPSPGVLRVVRSGDYPILLCTVDERIFAYHDACPDTPLPLSLGQLDGDRIVCPWHGCQFDVRTGERLEHRGTGLESLPVAVENNRIRVELDTV